MALQKHLLNDADTLVVDSLTGLCAVNNQLAFDPPNKVVYKATLDRSKVALICGGGSGHEPSHAGFVGEGMLSAAVCGNVFASPNASQVRRGIDLVENDAGTLILVKNYTGDILNFGLAAEQYAAEHADKSNKVKFVVVGEDVAVGKTQGGIVGRRGLAGVVLVYKIAGALAAQGGSLEEVHDVAQYVASRIGTIGVGLEHCHVPGTAAPTHSILASEIEIGLGIHNEAGNQRISPIPPLSQLIPQLLDYITSTTDPERSFLPFKHDGKDEVVLLVNNLGGLSELELGGVVRAARDELAERKIVVSRVISGTIMTSLNMPGFSISLVLLPRAEDTQAPKASFLLSLLDAPAQTPGWKWSSGAPPVTPTPLAPPPHPPAKRAADATAVSASKPSEFVTAIQRACDAVVAAEAEITRMDTIAGDGDCGLTLKSGAQAVQKAVAAKNITGTDLVGDLLAVAKVAETDMGGTSGALYSIFFSALAQGVQGAAGGQLTTATPELWATALTSALKKLYTYTRARPPSRTLVDPLAAFVESYDKGFSEAVKAAAAAAEHTKDVDAKAGRSAYVDSALLTREKVADPGAWGVKTILEAI
ncbi:Dihydroxyacetone kinase [Mycena indigotica]|uniref:Dihydroxyacetone kinase n=1 Tax=Mycena indigotica TaxID=2126181 RepID=A0A8H6SQB0_9AGAR|nr:Dihydroxyacetone kinase [Mycena indigotica]KAF7303561.1 Dihydroxyacetone kinase [Mycena indigotica]